MSDIRSFDYDPEDGNGVIRIRCEVTSSPRELSLVEYIDPQDGAPFDADSLSPRERGHTYEYIQTGGTYRVHSPYRVYDAETERLMVGLDSFRVLKPWRKLFPDEVRNSKNKPCCLQHFTLDECDFTIFSQRVIGEGEDGNGVLIDCSVTLDQYIEALTELHELANQVQESIVALRGSQMAIDGQEKANLAQGMLQAFVGLRSDLNAKYTQVMGLAQRLTEEGAGEDLRLTAKVLFKEVDEEVHKVRSIVTTREAKIIEDARRSAMGRERRGVHLGLLRDELGLLTPYFPQMQHLDVTQDSVKGEILKLRLVGFSICMSAEALWVEGDPDSIYRYVERQVPIAAAGDDLEMMGSRFAGITAYNLDDLEKALDAED